MTELGHSLISTVMMNNFTKFFKNHSMQTEALNKVNDTQVKSDLDIWATDQGLAWDTLDCNDEQVHQISLQCIPI